MEGNVSIQNTMKNILTMCHGFPGEIRRVAYLLSKVKPEEWDEVLHHMLAREIDHENKMRGDNIFANISLSYEYLVNRVKLAIFYMARFPPARTVMVSKLFLMWMAEGFTGSIADSNTTLFYQGFHDFVIPRIDESSGNMISYRLKEMFHKLCVSKAKEEGLFWIVNSETPSIKSSVMGSGVTVYLHDQLKGNDISSYIDEVDRIRSFHFYGDEESDQILFAWPIKFADFKDFKWTRVLNFDGIDFRASKLPTSIDTLFFLRFLCFEKCYLEEFTLSCSNFPFLETLDLNVKTKMIIPNVLRKLSKLTYLYLPEEYQCKTHEKLKLDTLTKLELIENFHAGVCDINDIQELEHLSTLIVIAEGDMDISEFDKLTRNKDGSNRKLELSLILKDFDGYPSEKQDTLKKLLERDAIQNLYLEGYIKRMPEGVAFSNNFTRIVFDGTEFQSDPMPILGGLKNLSKLVLCNDAITVDEISCKASSFEKLKIFEITNLESLRTWVLERGAMQWLSTLKVRQCNKLLRLPVSRRFWSGFCKFRIGATMPKEFKESLPLAYTEVEDKEYTSQIMRIWEV